ncbi:MAG: HAD family hydrolase [Chloroflexi bacterium]|nr:HAD family hydrolase [Chloroflexota bacterium]
MLTPILLFDLGDTLVQYYQREEFPPILQEAIQRAKGVAQRAGFKAPSELEIARRVKEESHEARNYRVRPLEKRLIRIFGLPPRDLSEEFLLDLCRAFLGPIFSVAKIYSDTLPTLNSYRAEGYRIGILSNLPWGAPASLWQEEVNRHGILELCEVAIFCSQVGWRKPARPIFRSALEQFSCLPHECLFIGDNPHWDIMGARRAGMSAVLIDRRKNTSDSIESLWSLSTVVSQWKKAHFT